MQFAERSPVAKRRGGRVAPRRALGAWLWLLAASLGSCESSPSDGAFRPDMPLTPPVRRSSSPASVPASSAAASAPSTRPALAADRATKARWGSPSALQCQQLRSRRKSRTRARLPTNPTTEEKIRAAHQAGEITGEQGLLLNVYAEIDPALVPRRYAGRATSRTGCSTLLSYAARVWPCLSPSVQAEIACLVPGFGECPRPAPPRSPRR